MTQRIQYILVYLLLRIVQLYSNLQTQLNFNWLELTLFSHRKEGKRRKNPHLASIRGNDPTCLNFGECLAGVWKLSGNCLKGVWQVFDDCLEGVLWMSVRCLEGVLKGPCHLFFSFSYIKYLYKHCAQGEKFVDALFQL